MQVDLNTVIDEVSRQKNLGRDVLVQALEQAILTAAKKTFGFSREMEANFNTETGCVDLFLIVNVVADDAEEGREITLEDANKSGLEADLGDELLFQIFYRAEDSQRASEQDQQFGDMIELKNAHRQFGRIAAQTAKQVIFQRVREAERDNVYNAFKDRKGELILGTVRRFERGSVVIELDTGEARPVEAVLPVREQVPRESYRSGDSIKALVLDIDRAARGPQIILSRAGKGLLEKLFETEVPEIYEKIVRIESSAREPGARAKIAVASRDRDVDPVGACVGMKGSRVQAVVQELRGEKIDIVPYNSDPARYVCNAIAPAEVSRVIIDAEGHKMELIVPDDKLSLAIGKKGQNVRLASQLTGWKIGIHSESKIQELETKAKTQMAEVEGVGQTLADGLFRLGWRSVGDLARAQPAELAPVETIESEERAQAIIASAQEYIQEQRKRQEARRKEQERRSNLSDTERWLEVESVDEAIMGEFVEAGCPTVEQLARADESRLVTAGMDPKLVALTRHRARIWLGQLPADAPEPGPEDFASPVAPVAEAETDVEPQAEEQQAG